MFCLSFSCMNIFSFNISLCLKSGSGRTSDFFAAKERSLLPTTVRLQRQQRQLLSKMSISRSPEALRRWQRLSSLLRSSRPLSIHPARLAHITTTTTTILPKTTRQFHSSPSLDAARSPSVRRAQASRVRQPTVSRETPLPPAQGSGDARKEFLEKNGGNLWAEAIKARVLDEKVDLDTFMRVSHELFKRAYTGRPSAEAIWEIDPGELYSCLQDEVSRLLILMILIQMLIWSTTSAISPPSAIHASKNGF